MGTLAAGQVNSNNIGIPLSLYLLGSAAYPAPVILLQLLVFTPITMAIFEAVTTGQRRPFPILRRTLTNPIVVGSVRLSWRICSTAGGSCWGGIVPDPFCFEEHRAAHW